MIRYLRYLFCAILLFIVSTNSHVYGEEALSLRESLDHGKKVTLIVSNDNFTDSDSITSCTEALYLSHKYSGQINLIFHTDDEANPETVDAVVKSITDGKCFKEMAWDAVNKYAPLREHYQNYYTNRDQAKQIKHGFRVQDTAAVLYPLADQLGMTIHIVQGEISTNPTYNPYLGNFGVDYGAEVQPYLDRIHPETGSQAIIKFIVEGIKNDNSIYILNGGSVRLLNDLQTCVPHLLPYVDVTAMLFRQPMDFPPLNLFPVLEAYLNELVD